MNNEAELDAAIEWYENADWGNEDYKEGVVRGFQAGAEWQRTQSQPADAYRMARALSDRYADQCGVDKDDYWKLYGQDCIDDVRAMLEGAKHE